MSGTAYLSYEIDQDNNRVVIDIRGYHELGSNNSSNDIQIILFCDTGNIQISYINCDFIFDQGSDHWSIGISEPNLGDQLQQHDFVNHISGQTITFANGAIYQYPEYTNSSDYMGLNGRAILFTKIENGWEVLVDLIPY